MDNNSLNNRVYTKFQRHVDNANEVVSAKHVNDVQTAVTGVEKDVIKLHDAEFIDKVLFSFNNNLFVNSLFADEVNDKKYIDFTASKTIKYNSNERSIEIDTTVIIGEMITTPIHSSLGNNIPLNDFFLMTDEYVPVGSNIKYYLVTDKNEVFPIKANEPKIPCHIQTDIKSARIKAVMTKNAMGQSPKIFGMSLLFFDPAIEAQYGLTNPDLRRFEELHMGITILVRDRAQDDKLVKVIEPTSELNLYYNDDGSLKEVWTVHNDDGVRIKETLNYGEYINSKNETDWVLLSILSATENIQALPNDYSYKFFE